MKARNLSEFCMEMSFLLEAGIPLDGGLNILAEDAAKEQEREMLTTMAEKIEMGRTLDSVMAETGEFPVYVIRMAQVGQETGTLDVVMRSLSEYYDRESTLAQTIKNAVTYPLIMISMLILVLFVLLTKVMPVFEGVYQQLGAELSPITKSAMEIGSVVTGCMLLVIAALAVFAVGVSIAYKNGQKQWAENMLGTVKEKSHIAVLLAKRRLSAILAISIRSGLSAEKGVEMAEDIVAQKKVQAKIIQCKDELEKGEVLYDALKEAVLFDGIDLQMIKVGSRSGKLDEALEKIAEKYEAEVDESVDTMIARFEPTMVIVLAIAVGLILLSVMMPLVGVMATIG